MKVWGKIVIILAIVIATFITIGIYSSREVLSAFGKINEKLEKVNTQSLVDNDSVFNQIQNDTLKFRAVFLRDFVKEFHENTEELKEKLLEGVGTDYSKGGKETTLFLKEGVITEEGKQFVNSLQEIQKILIENTNQEDTDIIEQIDTLYSLDSISSSKKKMPWLQYHFEGFPVISSVTKLTSIQNDIQAIEKQILVSFLEK